LHLNWFNFIASNEFKELTPKGTIPSPRVLKSIGVINKRIYVFGGGFLNNQPVNDTSMYCLDYNSQFWFKLTGTNVISPKRRLGHTLTAVGKYLYLFGGMDGDLVFNDLWRFDTAGNKWEELVVYGQIPEGRCAHAAVEIDGVLYIIGGMSTLTNVGGADDGIAGMATIIEQDGSSNDPQGQVEDVQDGQLKSDFTTINLKKNQISLEPKQNTRTINQPQVFDTIYTINLGSGN
jgi:N-acetylneuraminic acid mutarotase